MQSVRMVLVQYCNSVLCLYKTHIINCCIERDYFSKIRKYSVITTLPKINCPGNYNDLRPVNILPDVSEIIEIISTTLT